MIKVVNKKTYELKKVYYECYVGRPNPLGNPYTHLPLDKCQAKYKVTTPKEAVDKYRTWLAKRLADDQEVINAFDHLLEVYENNDYNELVLICWCKPGICHGDILSNWILRITDQKASVNRLIGYYRFLSNFYPVEVEYEGIQYPTTENAYQAAKFGDEDLKRLFATKTPREVYKETRGIKPRDDWDEVKVGVMYDLLKLKFSHGSEFANKLLKTGDKEIIEGNLWHDTFWGVCNGVGENNLGKLLMRVRKELRK